MTQPTAAFGVRPDPLLEPNRRPSFRLSYDDLQQFAWRRLREDVAPELSLDTIARLDSALNDRATWCSLGGDVAALDVTTIAATHFAHGVGPSAHEAVDAPVARHCTYVHRLGVWLTERRLGEGLVACLLRHEGSEVDDRRYPQGLAAELVEFREARRDGDLPAGVRRGRGPAAGEPYDYVIEADPGLEGKPARAPAWRGVAVEVAQAIGSRPELHRSWGPGDDLSPLRDVIRDRLEALIGAGREGTLDELHRALAVLGTVETVKATGGAAEIAGVRLEPCDDYGRTRSHAIAPAVSPAGRKVAELLGEMVNSGIGFDPQVLADAVGDMACGCSPGCARQQEWLQRRPWLEPLVLFLEASDDAPLDFAGNTAPPRLQRILEAAYGTGVTVPPVLPDTAHTDATPGDTAVILDDDVDLAPGASAAATAVGAELARQLGRPRDDAGHRHFDAQALAAAALQAVGVGERPAERRMLLVEGQTIRTADGEEVVAMCSERSWARLLVDAWHTFPLTDPDAPVGDGVRAFGPRVASDGGLVPADVGWTPPLTAENAAELEGRGIDIVGAPVSSPLCVCGHERAVHDLDDKACAVLSSVPHHDCSAYEAAVPEGRA